MLGVHLPGPLRRLDWRVPLVGAWAVFLLLPLWKTGWLHDDMFNASLRGLCIHCQCTPVENTLNEIHNCITIVGRINPLIHVLKEATFILTTDLFWYKTMQAAGVLANLYFFYSLLKRLGASPDCAALCCLAAVTLIQFRFYPDPVLAFNNLMQWLFLGTVLSLGLFHRYLTKGGAVNLLGSVLLYLLTALTYEITYLFCILHIGLLLTTKGGWTRALSLAPFVAIPVLLTAGSMWLRRQPGYQPGGYGIGLSLGPVVQTSLKQFTAAFPGSFAALSHLAPMHGVFSWKTLTVQRGTLALGFLAAAPLAVGLTRQIGGRRSMGALLVLGLLLAVLPVPLIAVARRYQDCLLYGGCHLPVYIQYFGVALLFVCGVSAWAGRARVGATTVVIVVGVLVAGVAAFHSEANARVVAALREPYLTPRREVEDVLESGRLLAGVPADTTLVVDWFPWDTSGGGSYFYSQHTRTRLKDVVLAGIDGDKMRTLPSEIKSEDAEQSLIRVRYIQPGTDHGYAIAGRLHYLRADSGGAVLESGVSQVRLAVRRAWRAQSADRPFLLHAACTERPLGAAMQSVAHGAAEMRRTAVTKDWTVYEVNIPNQLLDGESMWLEFDPPERAAGE